MQGWKNETFELYDIINFSFPKCYLYLLKGKEGERANESIFLFHFKRWVYSA